MSLRKKCSFNSGEGSNRTRRIFVKAREQIGLGPFGLGHWAFGLGGPNQKQPNLSFSSSFTVWPFYPCWLFFPSSALTRLFNAATSISFFFILSQTVASSSSFHSVLLLLNSLQFFFSSAQRQQRDGDAAKRLGCRSIEVIPALVRARQWKK